MPNAPSPPPLPEPDINEKLFTASHAGDETLVKDLLLDGASDKYRDGIGNTALMEAASLGKDSIVVMLLYGAELNTQNHDGDTALHKAARGGHNEVITTLIANGADLKIQNKDLDTALHKAARGGHNDVITTLIENGADLNIQNKDLETAVLCAAERGHNQVVIKLFLSGADMNKQNKDWETPAHAPIARAMKTMDPKEILQKEYDNNVPYPYSFWISSAIVQGEHDLAYHFLEKNSDKKGIRPDESDNDQCALNLVQIMLIKDPAEISSVLNFLTKKLDNFEYKKNKEQYQKTKENLEIEKLEGKEKMMFYNVKRKEFDNKSLLQFINLENVRLSRQREELIDLSVKIADLNHSSNSLNSEEEKVIVDTKKAMEEVIYHYKTGLPSGAGLRDMIKQIKERYPWSASKKRLMILASIATCILGVGLFGLDIYTDIQFSWDLWNINRTLGKDDESFKATFIRFLSKNDLKFRTRKARSRALESLKDLEEDFDRRINETSNDFDDYKLTSGIAICHCILPIVITMIVFISMRCRKGKKILTPFELANFKSPKWWGLNIFCCIPNLAFLGKVLPIPAFTHLYRCYLDIRCHKARSKPDFRTKIVQWEKKIRKHEAIGKL